MRVLYVNHTGTMSGAEHSLMDLLRGLPDDVEAAVACPPGELATALAALGVTVVPIRGMDASLRLHPVHTTMHLIRLASSAAGLRRAARRGPGVDVVHANSVRGGLLAAVALAGSRTPLIVHVRDCLPDTRVAHLISGFLRARAASIVANSGHTAERFAGRGRARIRWVHNPVDLGRFDPELLTRSDARARLDIVGDAPVLAIVGQISPWKAQADAIRILAGLRAHHPDARLLIAGEPRFVGRATRYDNTAYWRELHALVVELGLGDAVRFLGHRDDVATVMRAADLVLVPSWEEPFGRSVIEAMAMETPVAATAVGGPPEIITDGEDGLLLPPRDPAAWIAAIGRLLGDPDELREMGRRSRRRVESSFRVEQHVAAMLGVYREVMTRRRGS